MLMESQITGVKVATRIGAPPVAPLEAAFVDAVVRSAFRITVGSMRCAERGSPRTAFARQVAIYLMHTQFGLTLTDAGRHYGRDRTTAAHACHVVEARRENVETDAIVEWLGRALDAWMTARIGGRA